MYISDSAFTTLSQTLNLYLSTLEDTLASDTAMQTMTPECIEQTEFGVRVIYSALHKINEDIVADFEEIERIYIQHAITLHMDALTNSLRSDEVMTKAEYETCIDTMHTLLQLHQYFQ